MSIRALQGKIAYESLISGGEGRLYRLATPPAAPAADSPASSFSMGSTASPLKGIEGGTAHIAGRAEVPLVIPRQLHPQHSF